MYRTGWEKIIILIKATIKGHSFKKFHIVMVDLLTQTLILMNVILNMLVRMD